MSDQKPKRKLSSMAAINIALAVLALLAFVLGNGTLSLNNLLKKKIEDQKPKTEWSWATDGMGSLSGAYLATRHAASEQDMKKAAEYSAEVLQRDPENIEVAEESLRLLIAAGEMDKATRVAAKLMEKPDIEPGILPFLVALVDHVKRNEFTEAKALVDKSPKSGATLGFYGLVEPVFELWLNLGAGDHDQSFEANAALRKVSYLDSFVYYQLALMNDMVGRTDRAKDYYEKAATKPDDVPYRLVQARSNFYLRQGDKEKARKPYEAYAAFNPTSKLVPDTIPDIDKDPIAISPLVQSPQQGIAEVFFTAASLLFSEDAMRDTLLYLRLSLYLRPDFPPAQLMLANLQEYALDYAGAIKTYEGIDHESVFYQRGLIRMALNYEMLKQTNEAERVLKLAMQFTPNSSEPYVTLGDIMRTKKDYHKSIQAYTKAIGMAGTPKEDDWRLFYARGTCYERAGNWELAEADLKKALELSPGQADVLNYLGYSWLVAGKNLKQAKEYIEQALEASPLEAHIIDSMGWANYVLGDYDKAIEFLEQATSMVPQDATINDHLGDAYWRAGRKIEARFQWQRALNFDPEDKNAIEMKLKQGLPSLQPQSDAKPDEPVASSQSDPLAHME